MPSSIDADIIFSLTALHAKMHRSLDGGLTAHGISFTEFQVMKSLHHSVDMTMKRIDLAHSVGLSASGVTRLLAPLEKIGIVKKQANARDARVSLVKLTHSGKALFIDAEKTVERSSDSMLADMDGAEKTALLALLKQLA